MTQCIGNEGLFKTTNLLVSILVDDLIAISSHTHELDDIEWKIKKFVTFEKLGKSMKLLGMEVYWDEQGCILI